MEIHFLASIQVLKTDNFETVKTEIHQLMSNYYLSHQ